MDTLTPAERSERMGRIRGQDTKPELLLRRALHGLGLRYRLHVKALPGKPDIVFPKFRTVLFVNGCFWHRHAGCKVANTPKTNIDFWRAKFQANVDRDQRNIVRLQELGWRVLIVWECETNTPVKAEEAAGAVIAKLRHCG
ncbi:very short patch repair endonuclease [Ramlibacter sp.]|uniref:very short patch repair endonuclease n=1 Tax=Ramlibacter sp. TaxID=1917967 RepID=UPI002FCB57CE